MSAQVWTSRDVVLTLHAQTRAATFDKVFEALPDHYWDTWRNRVLGTLSISSCDQIITVGGWPWWVPQWVARRSVAKVAARLNVGCDIRATVDRAVLPKADS